MPKRTKTTSRNKLRAGGQRKADGKSKYARKAAWLLKHGMWGFDVTEPKPWRSR